jgi:DNA-binding transcriptional LysR family regulator
MELRQLRAFVAVAEDGTFTRAAERLGVVQPAVSQAVSRLEAELGLVLVERTSRRVALTGAGAAFLPEARGVLARLERAERAAADLAAGETGVVRLASTAGAPELVHALAARLSAAHPGVRIELARSRRSSKLRAVLDGEIDVALVHSAPPTPGIAFTEVWSEAWRVVAAAGHPRAAGDSVPLAVLARDPLVLVAGEGTAGVRDQFVAICRDAGFAPVLAPEQATLGDALVEIAQSTAWTMLRASNARDIARFGVVEVAVREELSPARLWLAHRDRPAAAARSLLAIAGRLDPAGGAGGPLV